MKSTVAFIVALICCAAIAEAQRTTRPYVHHLMRRRSTPKAKPRLISSDTNYWQNWQNVPESVRNIRTTRRSSVVSRAGFETTASPIRARNDEQLSNAVANLAFSIAQSVDGSGASDIFSPVSIMAVLNLLLLGADGATRKELLGALNMPNMDALKYHKNAAAMLNNLVSQDPQHLEHLAWKGAKCVVYDYDDEDEGDVPSGPKFKELRITNGIFTQTNLPISEKYRKLAAGMYGASLKSVNFRDSMNAASEINNWVSQATNGRIREVTNGQFNPETNMVLASSLYFKATWQSEFTARATRPRDFFLDGPGRAAVKVNMMTLSECLPYHYEKSDGFRMIGLPYSDNTTTMYVILPQNSTRSKVRALQNRLSADKMNSMIAKMTRRTATVNFPRMQLTSSTNLEKSFRRLGIKTIFNPQQSNLRNMLDQSAQGRTPLFVSQITHKVNLNVDEQGTEGAAVTVTLVDRSASSVYFNVNEPFLIYVRHDPTRLPLFYGAVFDPRG